MERRFPGMHSPRAARGGHNGRPETLRSAKLLGTLAKVSPECFHQSLHCSRNCHHKFSHLFFEISFGIVR
jgi:hypothetical protein